ncbi:hypothetical protein HanRHA438_Chr14g0679101 [Helianthus annuus]|uniref:Uncharacterized protein n=1 Tax=Helianthus annuus TaxID=4232 RepID=A0A9K3ECU2_HELAN|nr:uncharacterized protein LOC110904946 [Helianthus annuus]KAF5771168.1 hypothetical protein HanXRQr2_Chr14g0667551 [Helianthus annuus]KAJ0855965.1 hypothetical protein HanRHA438_Chr14g0679101 [Helianthus annuus]
MYTSKVTPPKTLETKQPQERTNNGIGESFRVLYYGSASAGSVPFMWESQPGTPKHTLAESSLPPLTPPPSYYQKYDSSMQVTNQHSSTRSGFFRTIFLHSSRKKNIAVPPSSSLSSSSISSSSSSSSHLHSWQSTPMKFGLENDEHSGDSPTSTLCLGEFKRSYRIKKMKKAMLSFVRNGKA